MTLQSKIESLQFKQAAIDAQIGDLEQKLVFEGHEAEITAYRALQAKLKEAQAAAQVELANLKEVEAATVAAHARFRAASGIERDFIDRLELAERQLRASGISVEDIIALRKGNL